MRPGGDLLRGQNPGDGQLEGFARHAGCHSHHNALPRATMERVLEIIRGDVAADKVQIDTPTQNLESYFLQVVQNARQAAAETSGATSGARVAAYLRGNAEAKPVG